jgi:zinc resistance-associated protein
MYLAFFTSQRVENPANYPIRSGWVITNLNKGGIAMRRVTTIIAVALLAGAVALPAFAWAHGWGRGQYMMGHWGSGPGYCYGYERGYGAIPEEQQSTLQELDNKFYEETATLRNEIRMKSSELNGLLNSSTPDLEKVKALQKELNNLRAQMDEKRLNYELEVRKVLPERRFGGSYGMGYGYPMGGYSPHMGYGW